MIHHAIKRRLKNDKRYYLSQALLMILGVTLIYTVREDKLLMFYLFLLLVFSYVGWGIVHHYLTHNISSKIVVEYVAMGSLGLTIVLFLLRGFIL